MTARDEFLKARLAGIGGSDAAASVGLSPWKSPLALYAEKIGEGEATEETDAMRFGTLLEPVIRGEYVRRTGRQVICDEQPRRHPQYAFMLANLDGFTDDGRVLEIKTARSDRDWGDPGTDDIPAPYILQTQHYLAVTGAELADVAVLIAGSDFRIYTVRRNPDLIELLVNGERDFWRCVETRTPPDPQTLADVNLRWHESVARQIELSPAAAAAVRRISEIKALVSDLEREAETAEAMVKAEMKDADTAIADGVVACTWKQAKPTQYFDSKAFRAAHPEIAAAFTSERPGSRRFLVKS